MLDLRHNQIKVEGVQYLVNMEKYNKVTVLV